MSHLNKVATRRFELDSLTHLDAIMIKRFLAAVFGGALIGVLFPISYVLLIGIPDTLMGLLWLASIGCLTGVIAGAILPKVFGFIFEVILDV